MRVTIAHMRRCGYCAWGIKKFFARHGLDFRDFLTHGIDADVLVKTGDAQALRVVGVARGQKQ